jgi:hypothetical protein
MTVPFWTWQLAAAMSLNCVVQFVSIAAYAARLAGARTGRVGTAMSLYNLFVTASRFASMLYSPMLGALSDRAWRVGGDGVFLWQLRVIVIAGTVGIILGTAAIPAFVVVYLRGIRAFERTGNVVKALFRLARPRTALGVLKEMLGGSEKRVFSLALRGLPMDALVLNIVVSAVYAIGIVSAAYASVLNPQAARTALLSSGLVNGAAVIAYNLVVDPASALMTDQAARGERTIDNVRALVTGLAITAILGFVISQALLIPAAILIERASSLVTGK